MTRYVREKFTPEMFDQVLDVVRRFQHELGEILAEAERAPNDPPTGSEYFRRYTWARKRFPAEAHTWSTEDQRAWMHAKMKECPERMWPYKTRKPFSEWNMKTLTKEQVEFLKEQGVKDVSTSTPLRYVNYKK